MNDISFIIDCLKRIGGCLSLDEAKGIATAAIMYHEKQVNPNCYGIKVLGYGEGKLTNCVKEIRYITGLGLREAKDITDNLPKVIKESMSFEDAVKTKKYLDAQGLRTIITPETEMSKTLFGD